MCAILLAVALLSGSVESDDPLFLLPFSLEADLSTPEWDAGLLPFSATEKPLCRLPLSEAKSHLEKSLTPVLVYDPAHPPEFGYLPGPDVSLILVEDQPMIIMGGEHWGLVGLEPRDGKLSRLWTWPKKGEWECEGQKLRLTKTFVCSGAGEDTYLTVDVGGKAHWEEGRGNMAVFRLTRDEEPAFIKMYPFSYDALHAKGGGSFHEFVGVTPSHSEGLLLSGRRSDYRVRPWALIPVDGYPEYQTFFVLPVGPGRDGSIHTFHGHAWGDMYCFQLMPTPDGKVWAAWYTETSGMLKRSRKGAGVWYAVSEDGETWSEPYRLHPAKGHRSKWAPIDGLVLAPDGNGAAVVYRDEDGKIAVCRDISGERKTYRLTCLEEDSLSAGEFLNTSPSLVCAYNYSGESVIEFNWTWGKRTKRFLWGLDDNPERCVALEQPEHSWCSFSQLDSQGSLHLLLGTWFSRGELGSRYGLVKRRTLTYRCIPKPGQ